VKTTIAVTASSMKEALIYQSAGADEVILPLAPFAMTSIPTVSMEEIPSGQPVSLLMNRLLFEEEMPALIQTMERLSKMEICSIYFADPSIAMIAEQVQMTSKLIYKPDTLMASPEDARWWLNQNIQAVCVSPLLTKEEAEEMTSHCAHCVLTIHGHLMMSASRRQLLSAYETASGRTLNLHERRNLRIQEISRKEEFPIYESQFGTLIDTDYVLESFELLHELMEHGAASFLIESAGMGTEETADAIKSYRKIMEGTDAAQIKLAYEKQYPELILSSGYYMEKTIR
jgi:collagenase-like PrtC family protease